MDPHGSLLRCRERAQPLRRQGSLEISCWMKPDHIASDVVGECEATRPEIVVTIVPRGSRASLKT